MEESFDKKLIIKISVDGVIHHDCIQLKDYRLWYEKYIQASDSKIIADELMFAEEVAALDFQQDVIFSSEIDPQERHGPWNLFLSALVLKIDYMKKSLVFILFFLNLTQPKAQTFVDHPEISFSLNSQVCFLDGHKTYFGAINKLSIADIHEAEFRVSYSYPSGALMVRTNHFVNDLRPEFYRHLQKWLRSGPKKNFIIDGKPLKNRKALLAITEKDIEGFSFLSIKGKEGIEIILVPDFGINYR